MTTQWKAVAATIAALWAGGCTAQARSPEPVPVDRVECARCRMLISTQIGSAQILSARDDTRFYDDPGCLAADWPSHRNAGAIAYVQLASGGWKDVQSAWFARSTAARTPMASGLVAYATAADAKAADRDARALTWDDVVRLAGAPR